MIESDVQKKLWPDYLSGCAFTLVEKIENINGIWEKLIGSFGNVRLLLQNKTSALEKQNALWKVTGDEKIGMGIAILLNTMSELKILPEKFGLELYCVLRNEFAWQCSRKKESSLVNVRTQMQKNLRLVKFLKKELDVRERLTFLNKSKNCLGH